MAASEERAPPKVEETPLSEKLRDRPIGETHKLPNLSRMRTSNVLETPAVATNAFFNTEALPSAAAATTGTENVDVDDAIMTDNRYVPERVAEKVRRPPKEDDMTADAELLASAMTAFNVVTETLFPNMSLGTT
jgi:hypothetical protein